MVEKTVFSVNGVEKTEHIHMKEWNGITLSSNILKTNTKWNKDLNVRPKTKNLGEKKALWILTSVLAFFNTSPGKIGKGNKNKNRQMGLHQTEKGLHSKRNH